MKLGGIEMRGYSKVILAALRARGHTDDEIRRMSGATAPLFASVIADEREFTDLQLRKIEKAVDRSVGCLAAEIIEPDGGPFAELMEGSDRLRRSLNRAIDAENRRAALKSKALGAVKRQVRSPRPHLAVR
jgi:hypothetical protein